MTRACHLKQTDEQGLPLPTPKPGILSSKTQVSAKLLRSNLAQEGGGTRRLEGSPELLLGRAREAVSEGELDVRVLRNVGQPGTHTAARKGKRGDESSTRKHAWAARNDLLCLQASSRNDTRAAGGTGPTQLGELAKLTHGNSV